MSKQKTPPVPPAGRSNKGPGEQSGEIHPTGNDSTAAEASRRNFDKQGRQGNLKVNTTNQGYQQDR